MESRTIRGLPGSVCLWRCDAVLQVMMNLGMVDRGFMLVVAFNMNIALCGMMYYR